MSKSKKEEVPPKEESPLIEMTKHQLVGFITEKQNDIDFLKKEIAELRRAIDIGNQIVGRLSREKEHLEEKVSLQVNLQSMARSESRCLAGAIEYLHDALQTAHAVGRQLEEVFRLERQAFKREKDYTESDRPVGKEGTGFTMKVNGKADASAGTGRTDECFKMDEKGYWQRVGSDGSAGSTGGKGTV